MTYSIDTSALLDGWLRYYPPDVFPTVWTRIGTLVTNGVLIATEEVLREIERKDAELYAWAMARESMFIPLDDQIQLQAQSILAHFPKLVDRATGRSRADPFVIALARVKNCAVVTGERLKGDTNRPHIPDVCSALSIRYLGLLQMFREQGWTV